MWDFLSELFRNRKRTYTVMLMDEHYREEPRTYTLKPEHLLALLGGVTLGIVLLVIVAMLFTPIRQILPGGQTAELEQEARLSALRLAALEDSLVVQQEYMDQLRRLLLGDFEVSETDTPSETDDPALPLVFGDEAETQSEDWADHSSPALSLTRMPAGLSPTTDRASSPVRYLSSLQLPVGPPVAGIVTRGFEPRNGHYGIDFAVEEGTMVRSVGDGYVILADWTHDGGYTVAIQHADGFVSVYKHNQRLLKRRGDRVRAQETIALSGNTGEMSTGPHLHFELWQNGLAQDPRPYLVGH